MKTRARVPGFSATIDVDVDIRGDQLHDAGWHHRSECGGHSATSLGAAVASLHRQAHPGQARDVAMCHEEPCRSLTLAQLGEVEP